VIPNKIICGDFLEVMKDWPENSIDMIFVDPPYGKEGISNYINISKMAKRVLKEGHFAVFYASDYWFKETFIPVCENLNFFYLFHILNRRGHNSVFPRKIFQAAKTIMVFTKGKSQPLNWVCNLLSTEKSKSHRTDNWEQSVDDAMFFIDAFTKEGDLVVDPNVGSGTTCVAAKQLGRNYIGIDISEKYCGVAENRLAQNYLI